MTISEKQLAANRANAKKGGVKTSEGKSVVRLNALKHGLLSKEVVITVGEGAEDPEAYRSLIYDLMIQLKPAGIIEEMLVEKIAASYWRLQRAYKFEVGLIRRELDDVTENYYDTKDWEGRPVNNKQETIMAEIQSAQRQIAYWQRDKKKVAEMFKSGESIEAIYEWDDNWASLLEELEKLLEDADDVDEPAKICDFLKNECGWSEARIWKAHINVCASNIKYYQKQLDDLHIKLETAKKSDEISIQVRKSIGNIPGKDDLERLLRYENTILRNFYKALNQLERLQRMRLGDNVPPPVQLNIDKKTDNSE